MGSYRIIQVRAQVKKFWEMAISVIPLITKDPGFSCFSLSSYSIHSLSQRPLMMTATNTLSSAHPHNQWGPESMRVVLQQSFASKLNLQLLGSK